MKSVFTTVAIFGIVIFSWQIKHILILINVMKFVYSCNSIFLIILLIFL